MFIKLQKAWLGYVPGDIVECAPNEGQWLVRTERGVEITEEEAHAAGTAPHQRG